MTLADPVRQRVALWWLDQYGGGLFLPLRDATAGTTSYGGGRFLLDTAKGADLGSADRSSPWVGDGRLRFNLESALGIGKVMDDAVCDRLVEGWNGTISTLDDVRFRGRGEGRPMPC